MRSEQGCTKGKDVGSWFSLSKPLSLRGWFPRVAKQDWVTKGGRWAKQEPEQKPKQIRCKERQKRIWGKVQEAWRVAFTDVGQETAPRGSRGARTKQVSWSVWTQSVHHREGAREGVWKIWSTRENPGGARWALRPQQRICLCLL